MTEESAPSTTAKAMEHAEVIVAGGGFGGLVAAATAAERGKRVLLLEAGAQVGGTVALSSGLMHMYDPPSWEAYRKALPTIDEDLGRAMFERFPEFVDWLRGVAGVPMTKVPLPADPYKDPSRVPGGYVLGLPDWLWRAQPVLKRLSEWGYSLLGEAYLFMLDRLVIRSVRTVVARRLWAAAEHHGARVALSTRVRGIERTEDGSFLATCDAPRGLFTVSSKSVVLATGGFQGNPALLRQHVGSGGAKAMCRAVETNRGDGLQLGLDLGGVLSGPMDRFYGYPMAALGRDIDRVHDSIALLNTTAYYASSAVLVTSAGARFVDEPAAGKNSEVAHDMITHADGECWAILDATIRKKVGHRGFGGGLLPPMDLLRNSRRRGANVIEAASLEELVQKLGEAGVARDRLASTLEEYNRAAKEKAADKLVPPRTGAAEPLAMAPFYALRLVAGVSLTYGGLRINGRAQLVDSSGQPIPGVYAVPGLAGGLFSRQYGGALASCGTFGRIAGAELS